LLTITTNNVPRDLLSFNELTKKEQEWFDYPDEPDSLDFFRYKGQVYSLCEFDVPYWHQDRIRGWHGIQSDTFFSGTLVKLCDDDEQVIVGRYYS